MADDTQDQGQQPNPFAVAHEQALAEQAYQADPANPFALAHVAATKNIPLDSAAPMGSPGFAGGLADIGRGLAHGVISDFPQALGQAAEYFGAPQVAGPLEAFAKEQDQAHPELRKSQTGQLRQAQDTTGLSLRGNAYEAGSNAVVSEAPGLAGAAIGAGLGSVVPGVGTLGGAAAGYIAGKLASLPIMGGQQAQQSSEAIEKGQKAAGATPEQAASAARTGGAISGAIEAGGELAGDLIPFHALLKPFAKPVAGAVVKSIFGGGLRQAAVRLGEMELAENATEMAQQAGEAQTEKIYGSGGEGATMKDTLSVVVPTTLMTLVPGVFAAAHNMRTVGNARKALTDPNADPAQRAAAAALTFETIKHADPALAQAFQTYAADQIQARAPVEFGEDKLYRDYAAAKLEEQTLGEGPGAIAPTAPEAPAQSQQSPQPFSGSTLPGYLQSQALATNPDTGIPQTPSTAIDVTEGEQIEAAPAPDEMPAQPSTAIDVQHLADAGMPEQPSTNIGVTELPAENIDVTAPQERLPFNGAINAGGPPDEGGGGGASLARAQKRADRLYAARAKEERRLAALGINPSGGALQAAAATAIQSGATAQATSARQQTADEAAHAAAQQEAKAQAQPGEQPAPITPPPSLADIGTASLFPFATIEAAQRRASAITQASGEEHVAVPHPFIHDKFAVLPQENVDALQEPGAGALLQRQPGGAGEAGGERGRVQPGVQGAQAAEASTQGGGQSEREGAQAGLQQGLTHGQASTEGEGAAAVQRANQAQPAGAQAGEAAGAGENGAAQQQGALTDQAAHEAATSPQNQKPEPTPAQIEAGNYAKGHLDIHGLDVSIENPEGSTRRSQPGVTPPWESKIQQAHYGYIRGTLGKDGDHVDAFVKPGYDAAKMAVPVRAYVIDQPNAKGDFDEHKVMLGYGSQAQAVKAYLANYPAGHKVGPVTPATIEQLKDWLANGDTTKPFAQQAYERGYQSIGVRGDAVRVHFDSKTAKEKAEYPEGYEKVGKVIASANGESHVELNGGKMVHVPSWRVTAFEHGGEAPKGEKDTKRFAKAKAAREQTQYAEEDRGHAEFMRSEIGWAERGGRIIREHVEGEAQHEKGQTGGVIGRTKWIPRSDFWPNRPDKALSEKAAYVALDKAGRGEPLKPIEQRFVSYAIEQGRALRAKMAEAAAQEHAIPVEVAQEALDALPSDYTAEEIAQAFDAAAYLREQGFSDDQAEAIIERAAMRADSGEDYEQAVKAEAEGARRGHEEGAGGAQQAAAAEGFDLTGQTDAEIVAAEEAAKARAEAEARAAKEAEQRAQADRERASFALTGSSRQADEAAARGQHDLLSAPPEAPQPQAPPIAQEEFPHRRETWRVTVRPYDGPGPRQLVYHLEHQGKYGWERVDAEDAPVAVAKRGAAMVENALRAERGDLASAEQASGEATAAEAAARVLNEATEAPKVATPNAEGTPVGALEQAQRDLYNARVAHDHAKAELDKLIEYKDQHDEGREETKRRDKIIAEQHDHVERLSKELAKAQFRLEAAQKAVDELHPLNNPRNQQDLVPPAAPKGGTLEDVGENLWANRRNFRAGIGWSDVKDLNDALKVREVQKAKVWQKPNYEELVRDGMNPIVARVIKQIYDGIATAPTKRDDASLKAYIEAVQRVRDDVFAWAKDPTAVKAYAEAAAAAIKARAANRFSFGGGAGLSLSKLWMQRLYPGAEGNRSFWRENPEAIAEARLLGGNRFLRAIQFDVDDVAKMGADIQAGWPAPQEAWQKQFRIQRDTVRGEDVPGGKAGEPQERFNVYEKNSRWRLASATTPKEGFATEAEAIEHARELAKRERNTGGADIRGANVSEAEREGPPRRAEGQNVSAHELATTFGFRGVNFGRKGYINDAQRQAYVNAAYDGLMDLAEILGVPPKALSLGGQLGIAFGAQGRGGNAAAHFVPGVNEINLTKTMGSGTLAHEFGHALDHYFATLAGLSKEGEPYLSAQAPLPASRKVYSEGRTVEVNRFAPELRPEILAAFRAIRDAMEKRPMTEQETGNRQVEMRSAALATLNQWLTTIKANTMRQGDAAEISGKFEQLADRLRKGDLGDGYARVGGLILPQVVGRLRQLTKDARGRFEYGDNMKGLANAATHLKYLLDKQDADTEHQAQTTSTTFMRESFAKDKLKKGKAYWATPWEMFARAFETYVADKLVEKQQRNTFLSDAHERAAVKDREDATKFAHPYPRDAERARIDDAFDTLMRNVKVTEEGGRSVMFQRGDEIAPETPQPTFYSALSRAIDAKAPFAKDRTIGAGQLRMWLAARSKDGSFKADELTWSGLDDWLATQQGKVSKAEVQEFLDQNGVRVTETMLGERDDGEMAEMGAQMERAQQGLRERGYFAEMDVDGETGVLRRLAEPDEVVATTDDAEAMNGLPTDVLDLANEWMDAHEVLDGRAHTEGTNAARYADYTLPGGQNYHELLLTLPVNGAARGRIFAEYQSRIEALHRQAEDLGRPRAERDAILDDLRALQRERDERADREAGRAEGDFHSGHFHEPNILAHVRFDDRTDADGKRVLFIEEFQSDWAQKGRREGFAGAARDEFERWAVERGHLNPELPQEAMDRWVDANMGRGSYWQQFRHETKLGGEVPRAPFVQDTKAWLTLAMKRMIRYAAEHGYDRVAWTNGEQQAERYDLSKHIDRVEYVKNRRGNYQLSVYDPHGRNVLNRTTGEQGLVDLVGKEVADKIVRGEGQDAGLTALDGTKVLSGLDLKVGGEGMRAFYDQIVPQVANDVLRKLGGGKVGDVAMRGDLIEPHLPISAPPEAFRAALTPRFAVLHQPGLDITPAMRAAALRGQPLFTEFPKIEMPASLPEIAAAAPAAPATATRFAPLQTALRNIGNEPRSRYLREQESVRALSPLERNAVAAAVHHAVQLGMPQSVLADLGAVGVHPLSRPQSGMENGAAAYWPDQQSITVNEKVLADIIMAGDASMRAQLPGMLIHELGHRIDDDGFMGFASQASPLFTLEVHDGQRVARGEVMREAVGAFNKVDSPLHIALRYPLARFDEATGDPEHDRFLQTELFAQLYKLYHTNPSLVAREMPQAAALIAEINRGITDRAGEGLDGARRAVREALRAPSPEGGPGIGYTHGGPRFDAAGRAQPRYTREAVADAGAGGRDLYDRAVQAVADSLRSPRVLNPVLKNFQTQYHKANGTELGRQWFRPVFESAQQYLRDTARFANDAADQARKLLPSLTSPRDILRQGPKKADVQATAKAIFGATLGDVRPTDAELRAGMTVPVAYAEGEIGAVDLPALTDAQLELYHEARNAIDLTLDQAAVSEMVKLAQGENLDEALALAKDEPTMGAAMIEDALREQADALDAAGQTSEATRKRGLAEQVKELAENAQALKDKGYAPLMRFGQYAVNVSELVEGKPVERFFGMYETKRAAYQAERDMKELYPDATVTVGTSDDSRFTLFRGLSLDALGAFAQATGAAKGQLFQDFYKLAVSNRSALKRLIHRKGIAGYSEDLTRVLASYLTSSARLAGRNYHYGEMLNRATRIPAQYGDLRTEAAGLVQYVQNPVEEASRLRGLLFVNFLGGSVASALTNATQPVMMTVPYLSQFAGPARAVKLVTQAGLAAATGKFPADAELRAALERAQHEGVVEPQEIHQLYAESIRSLGSSLWARKVLRVWGSLFSLAESFNRRTTFIAAFQIAQNMTSAELARAGVANAFDFAEKAVEDTQGIYNRGNRPNVGRGPVGSVITTFKQFSIAYLEFLSRLPRREKLLAGALLLAAAGIQGAPGAEDLEDLIDTIGQLLGFNTNSKEALREWGARYLGGLGSFLTHGVSGIPGMPLDVQARFATSNLVPGTGLFKRSETDKTSDVFEFLGPLGGLVTNAERGFNAMVAGNTGGALQAIAPTAIANAMQALDMAQTGQYRDYRGRKVIDTTAADAALKSLGIQPADVAQASRRAGDVRQDIAMARAVETGIADRWARGILDKDPDMVRKAVQDLHDWNLRNPNYPIAITLAQIRQRVQQAMLERDVRLLKSAPKEVRGTVLQGLRQ